MALKYEEALATILDRVHRLDVTQVPLLQSVGQAIAEDVIAEHPLPGFDMAGPDGYAVRSDDLVEAGPTDPVTLQIVGTVRAGSIPRTAVAPGTAVRTMTGSPIPPGADCVIRFEDTDEPGNKSGPRLDDPREVRVFVAPQPGANIRRAGNMIAKGTLVLTKGSAIGPAQISALGSLGRVVLPVFRRPKVAIISTGDELVPLGRETLPTGKSYDSNSQAISALTAHYGATPQIIGIARDTETSVTSKIRKGMTADVIITSGGVSKGDYDLIRLVAGKMGEVVFSRINMGPGASFAFGLIRRDSSEAGRDPIPLFALSGPSAGCLFNMETLVRPALMKMMGFNHLAHAQVEASTLDPLSGVRSGGMAQIRWAKLATAKDGRSATVGPATVDFMEHHEPLTAMMEANSITIVNQNARIAKGKTVTVLPLDWTRDSLSEG